MIATFLTLMAAGVLSATMPAANQGVTAATLHQRALNLAEKEVEAIRTAGYANVNATQLTQLGLLDSSTAVSTNTYSFTNSDAASYDSLALVLPSGTGTVTIIQTDIDLVTVVINVNWKDQSTARTVQICTNIANI